MKTIRQTILSIAPICLFLSLGGPLANAGEFTNTATDMTTGAVVQWALVVALVLSVPMVVRWGRRHARGAMGGAAMMIGLAFGHLFDPAKAEAMENLMKRREQGEEAAEAGELLQPHL